MKALLVDDEETSQKLLEACLHDVAECEFASDGKDAFKMFVNAFEDDDPYDLICLDIHMPEWNGLEFLALVRKLEASKGIVGSEGVKVFVISNESGPHYLHELENFGCFSYLLKPLNAKKLHQELLRAELLHE